MNIQTTVKENAEKLLQKEMDRKDFLKHVGIAIVMVTGASTIIGALLRQKSAPQQPTKPVTKGYGRITYGGK